MAVPVEQRTCGGCSVLGTLTSRARRGPYNHDEKSIHQLGGQALALMIPV